MSQLSIGSKAASFECSPRGAALRFALFIATLPLVGGCSVQKSETVNIAIHGTTYNISRSLISGYFNNGTDYAKGVSIKGDGFQITYSELAERHNVGVPPGSPNSKPDNLRGWPTSKLKSESIDGHWIQCLQMEVLERCGTTFEEGNVPWSISFAGEKKTQVATMVSKAKQTLRLFRSKVG